jgi:8-oxo-dGTP pyrophosphatase MutT (NUDIX family)
MTDPAQTGFASRGLGTQDFTWLEEALRTRLVEPLPGHVGLREPPEGDPPWREAAVLVLVYPGKDGISTVLTVRSSALRNHPGQVSFPGGALEPGETPDATALREAREEIGLLPDPVAIGALSPVLVPPSRYHIVPVLAASPAQPSFRPDGREVDAILELPLDTLLDPGVSMESRIVAGTERAMPYVQAGPYRIWGATGLVLSELAEVWRAVRRG